MSLVTREDNALEISATLFVNVVRIGDYRDLLARILRRDIIYWNFLRRFSF